MVDTKHVFWQALLSAILIFGIGLLLGMWLEEKRTDGIEKLLLQSEINVLDSQLIGKINENFDVGCSLAKEELFKFADKIYNEAELLEKYDSSSQLTTTLQIMHRRYDLLRVMLWSESIKVKENCKENFHTIIYIYKYTEPTIEVRSEQTAFSRFLQDVKNEQGNKLLLIPIAGDLNLSSIELIKSNFGIKGYPAIIVDEKTKITSLEKLKDIYTLIG